MQSENAITVKTELTLTEINLLSIAIEYAIDANAESILEEPMYSTMRIKDDLTTLKAKLQSLEHDVIQRQARLLCE